MPAKAKSTKRQSRMELSEGPAEHRLQHTLFVRDILTPRGAPVIGRHRTRTILTPLAVRRTIIEDASAKPESVRIRSLRRRLTALDRALADCEAEMLERLTTCLNGLSHVGCIDLVRSEIRSAPFGREPSGEHKRREISAMTFVLKKLSPVHKSAVLELAALLDPSSSVLACKPGEAFVSAVCQAAAAVVSLYAEWSRQQKETLPPLRTL